MSRIGNRILTVPEGVSVKIEENFILVSKNNDQIKIKYDKFRVKPILLGSDFSTKKVDSSRHSRAQFGTINSLVSNAFFGFTKGFTLNLEIVGVGYKASMDGNRLKLDLGFSHPIFLDIPKDVKVKLISSIEIELSSFNKESLGEFASNIRGFRPPEPYKGKGIKYKGEVILRKVGKTSEGTKK